MYVPLLRGEEYLCSTIRRYFPRLMLLIGNDGTNTFQPIIDPPTRTNLRFCPHFSLNQIQMPKTLTDKQKELLKEFEALEAEKGDRAKAEAARADAAKRVKEYNPKRA
jgi:hypothetical protein